MIKKHKKDKVFWEYHPDDAKVLEKLPPARYLPQYHRSMSGVALKFHQLEPDPSLINFSSGVISDIVNKIDNFCSQEVKTKYESMKIVHQLGILLYGPTGTGKTSAANLIIRELVNKYDAVGLELTFHDPDNYRSIVRAVRRVTDNTNPIVILMDEFERLVKSTDVLHVLDGSMRENNVVFIGCTNHIDQIPGKIKERKSRVKYVREVSVLPTPVYKQFIKEKLPHLPNDELERIAFHASEKKLVIDELKHVLVDYFVDETPIETAIEELVSSKEG